MSFIDLEGCKTIIDLSKVTKNEFLDISAVHMAHVTGIIKKAKKNGNGGYNSLRYNNVFMEISC